MGRIVERFDGLATLGRASIDALSLPTPSLLWAPEDSPRSESLSAEDRVELRSEPPSAPGRRTVSVVASTASLRLDYAVPAPEIAGGPVPPMEVRPGVWLLHWPPPSEAWGELEARRPELVVLSNARTLLQEGQPMVNALEELRGRLGFFPVVWAPRVATPCRLAWLAYAGVDLVDSTEAMWRASAGDFLHATLGTIPADVARREGLCACPGCVGPGPTDLVRHTAASLDEEMRLVRSAARAGRLRELVEARLTAEPQLAELLRYTDRHLGPLLEERTPVVDSTNRSYVLRESQRRPEVVRFRQRVIERYRPPPSKRTLLLVPCSKTKPYRLSRSHRRLARALDGLRHPERVHLVSISSPLGAVPRELEDFFPARNYDIPVTGEWDEGEREAVLQSLRHLIDTGPYARIVAHLDPSEYGYLRSWLSNDERVRWTLLDDHTTAPAALDALHLALQSAESELPREGGGALPVVRDELEALATVQFGAEAAHLLFAPPVRLAGRPWFQRLTDGRGTDLATWREERGLFHLTVAGGQRILPARALWVEVGDAVPLTGDLFTPGVSRADPKIRIGDAVILTRAEALVAVGEAQLPGRAMTDLKRGLAVSVRHRVRGIVPTSAPTPT